MADIELVIRISDEIYKKLKDPSTEIGYYTTEVCNCVIKGKPLPKTGHWIDKSKQSACGVKFIHIECSECGELSGLNNTYARYCPWCGAKMIESQENKED